MSAATRPGPAAGLIATVAYAIPPVIRLTNVAIRGTDPEIVEAATRAIVMVRGQMVAHLPQADISTARLTEAAGGGAHA